VIRISPYGEPVSGKEAVAGNGTALHCRPLGPTAPRLPVKVRGWAYDRSGIERVEVFLDGRSRHEALYGLTRPHIEKALGASDALECGYYVQLDPFTCEPGQHEITVVATPKEGPPVGVSRSFMCADDTPAVRGEAEPSRPEDPPPPPVSVPLGAAPADSTSAPSDELAELRETVAAWKERALRAEAEAAAMLTERAQAQRGEERAFMFLRASEERRRDAERALRMGEIEIEPYGTPVSDADALAGLGTSLQCGRPGADAEVSMPVRLAGRAYSRVGIERVLVLLDGRARFEALYGLHRPDVARALGSEDAVSSGFALTLDLVECPPGEHTLTVVAIPVEGTPVGLTRSFRCRPADTGNAAHVTKGRYVPGAAAGTETEAAHRARYRWARSLAAGRAVLDAGCGVGYGTTLLASAGAASTLGVDVSPHAIKAATAQAGAGVRFEVADIERLDVADASFDLITCFEVIEYVEHPELALDELRRVLRPGGVLLFSSPNRGVYPPGNRWHVNEFSSAELEDGLRRRFADVTMYRQQALIASVIAGDPTSRAADEELELPLEVRKLVGTEPGEELYTLAAAGDGPLPALGELAVLAGAEQVIQAGAEAHAWRERALLAEAELAAARARGRGV
jgi:ubiquinone/menaquinone biosynthesis C-methylase UbiE